MAFLQCGDGDSLMNKLREMMEVIEEVVAAVVQLAVEREQQQRQQ